MKIIITEGQYDSLLKQVNQTIKSVTDPYKMLGITRPSQQTTKKKVKEPEKISGTQLMDGSTMYATNKYWAHIREFEGNPKNRVGGVKQPMLVGYYDSVKKPTIIASINRNISLNAACTTITIAPITISRIHITIHALFGPYFNIILFISSTPVKPPYLN